MDYSADLGNTPSDDLSYFLNFTFYTVVIFFSQKHNGIKGKEGFKRDEGEKWKVLIGNSVPYQFSFLPDWVGV